MTGDSIVFTILLGSRYATHLRPQTNERRQARITMILRTSQEANGSTLHVIKSLQSTSNLTLRRHKKETHPPTASSIYTSKVGSSSHATVHVANLHALRPVAESCGFLNRRRGFKNLNATGFSNVGLLRFCLFPSRNCVLWESKCVRAQWLSADAQRWHHAR
jgi:hypothetical protein